VRDSARAAADEANAVPLQSLIDSPMDSAIIAEEPSNLSPLGRAQLTEQQESHRDNRDHGELRHHEERRSEIETACEVRQACKHERTPDRAGSRSTTATPLRSPP
jgi:hypothetical protein